VFGDFDIMGSVLFPGKADSILIVDSDAVLSVAISLESLQAIAGRNLKIGDGKRIVQGEQAALGNRLDVGKLSDALPVKQAFGLFAGERPNQVLRISRYMLYVKRTTNMVNMVTTEPTRIRTIRRPELHFYVVHPASAQAADGVCYSNERTKTRLREDKEFYPKNGTGD
jgi:hypothetical protein